MQSKKKEVAKDPAKNYNEFEPFEGQQIEYKDQAHKGEEMPISQPRKEEVLRTRRYT
ncbi:MAG: hypothetical protein ABI863_22340 [Ginsengibacter sp.]